MNDAQKNQATYATLRIKNRFLSLRDIWKGLQTSSVWVLIIVNLIPIYGALCLGWDLSNLIQVYWFETIVVGIYFLLKLQKVFSIQPPSGIGLMSTPTEETGGRIKNSFFVKAAITFYFILSLAGAITLHGFFVFKLFGPFAFVGLGGFLVFILSLFFSHGVSYVQNFIGEKEYLRISVLGLFLAPYKRLVILHLAILIGAIIQNSWIFLVAIKLVLDVLSHIKEHRNKDVFTHISQSPANPAPTATRGS